MFQTKKKLSNYKNIHWIIALVVTIGLGYLFIMSEIVKMHDRRVMFYNLKTTNLNLSDDKINKRTLYSNNSPLFLIYEDKIIFGSVQNLVLPKPYHDVLILKKSDLLNNFKQQILNYKNKEYIFPSSNIGISFINNNNYTEQVYILSQIKELVKYANKKFSHKIFPDIEDNKNPSIVIIDTFSSL